MFNNNDTHNQESSANIIWHIGIHLDQLVHELMISLVSLLPKHDM